MYDYLHLVPHFLSAYIPILAVMIANPILYYKAVQSGEQYVDVDVDSSKLAMSLHQSGRHLHTSGSLETIATFNKH